MRNTIIAASLAAGLGLAASAWAQTEPAADQKAATGKQQTLTVTGCLKENTGSEGEFLLAKLPAGKTGATTTFRLVGDGKVNLKDHVGHKVEVKGMKDQMGSALATPTAPGEQKLTVTSLRHLSENCELPIAK